MGVTEPLTMHPSLKLLLILSAIFVASSSLRIAWITQHQLDIAHQSIDAGKHKRALIHYERAISAYLPFLPARKQALGEMKALCQQQRKEGHLDLALEGWRRLRGALLSSRSMFGQPNHSLLRDVNGEIARLAAITDTQGMMPGKDIQAEDRRLLDQHPKDINRFWGGMQFVFLMLWIGSTCWLIWRWTIWTVARRWRLAGVCAGSWFAWLVSLYLAG